MQRSRGTRSRPCEEVLVTDGEKNMSIGEVRRTSSSSSSNSSKMGKRTGKRPGRKPTKIDERAKLERSRQSARECRARKKLRYQYLEELVLNREKAVFALQDEVAMYKQWCEEVDNGIVSESLREKIRAESSASGSAQSPPCPEEIICFSSDDFTRVGPDSHKEDT